MKVYVKIDINKGIDDLYKNRICSNINCLFYDDIYKDIRLNFIHKYAVSCMNISLRKIVINKNIFYIHFRINEYVPYKEITITPSFDAFIEFFDYVQLYKYPQMRLRYVNSNLKISKWDMINIYDNRMIIYFSKENSLQSVYKEYTFEKKSLYELCFKSESISLYKF